MDNKMTNKFHYMSDLHLEFGMSKPMLFEGDNLILAGDITVLRCLNPLMNDAGNRKTRDRTLLFFQHALQNFKRVFYVTGNHESYNFNIQLEAEYIKKYLPGVIHVNNSVHEIDENTVLMGGTLWTDMDNSNPLSMRAIARGMNDFKIIYNGIDDNLNPVIWHPRDAVEKFNTTLAFLRDQLDVHRNKKVVVVTHHSPTQKGINPDHVRDIIINHGYYTDLEKFIADHPQIHTWVFGHTHIQNKFLIGETNVVSNARGYEGYEATAIWFNPDTWFEV